MSEAGADICLLVEGAYPHVTGGVSSWIQDLITTNGELRFHVVALVADLAPRPSLFPRPANLIGLSLVPLQSMPPGARSLKGMGELPERLAPHLLGLQTGAGLDRLAAVIRLVARDRPRLGARLLLDSEAAWRVITAQYRELVPEASFLDFFWSWRALMSGLFSTLLCDLPDARVYHAVSTGFAGLMLARAKIETGQPAILTEHGIYTNERRIELMMADWLYDGDDFGLQLDRRRRDLRALWIDTFMSYARACYEAADRIITLHDGNRRIQELHGADPGKLSIVPNGIDVARFAALPRTRDPDRPTVALIGRVVRIKDVKTFIRACSILQRRLPALQALVIGPKDEEPDYAAECMALADYLGLGERMRFVGRVSVTDYLPDIDVVALTSLSESQPLTLLEAGASGIPCVATDVGACREIIEGSEAESPKLGPGGAILPLAQPGAIATVLHRLLTDRDHYDRCAAAIRERIRRYYNKRELDARYAGIYRSLGAGGPAAAAGRAG